MGKVAKLLPEEYKQKAIANNIPLQTVYYRIEKNWDLERAVTQPPRKISRKRREDGEITTDRAKSHQHSFNFYDDKQELFDRAWKESGKTKSEFISDIVEDWLDKWAKKNKVKK